MFKIASLLLAVLAFASTTQAALVLHWEMNGALTKYEDSAGTNDLSDSAGPPPLFLPGFGVNGSGALAFNGTNQFLQPTTIPTIIAASNSTDWTASFWIRTTDSGTSTPYDGTPHTPVLGDVTGGIGFAMGVHGGTAAWRHYTGTGPFSGWVHTAGTVNVADDVGHYVTFVHNGSAIAGQGTIDIYVDGLLDVAGGPGTAGNPGSTYLFRDVARSYGPEYGHLLLDDVRLYDTALSAAEIFALFDTTVQVPEPSTCVLVAAGMLGMLCQARRRGRERHHA